MHVHKYSTRVNKRDLPRWSCRWSRDWLGHFLLLQTVKPLAIDLFCGLGGWTEGLLAEGYDVIGFDIEKHEYGDHRYPAQLVLQDVRTIHGRQFKDASLIVASPPCQEFSYMAMPWTLAKEKARLIRASASEQERLTELFRQPFRIQREAIEAAGHFIPLVVENVRGAQPWVGRSRWNFGSFHLWGDVPALMPIVRKSVKVGGLDWKPPGDPRHRPGQAFNPAAQSRALREERAIKNNGGSWFNVAHNTTSGKGRNPDGRTTAAMRAAANLQDGIKQGGIWFYDNNSILRQTSSKSPKRKAASAMIAKIPLILAQHIAASWKPTPFTSSEKPT